MLERAGMAVTGAIGLTAKIDIISLEI